MIEDYNDVHRDKCAKAFMVLKNCVVAASVSTFVAWGGLGLGGWGCCGWRLRFGFGVGCGLFGRDS